MRSIKMFLLWLFGMARPFPKDIQPPHDQQSKYPKDAFDSWNAAVSAEATVQVNELFLEDKPKPEELPTAPVHVDVDPVEVDDVPVGDEQVPVVEEPVTSEDIGVIYRSLVNLDSHMALKKCPLLDEAELIKLRAFIQSVYHVIPQLDSNFEHALHGGLLTHRFSNESYARLFNPLPQPKFRLVFYIFQNELHMANVTYDHTTGLLRGYNPRMLTLGDGYQVVGITNRQTFTADHLEVSSFKVVNKYSPDML